MYVRLYVYTYVCARVLFNCVCLGMLYYSIILFNRVCMNIIQLSYAYTLPYTCYITIYSYIHHVIDTIEDINVQQLASGVLNSNTTAHSSNTHTSNIRDRRSDVSSSSFQQGGGQGGDSSDSDQGHNSDHGHNDTDTPTIDRQSPWPSHRPSSDFYTRYTTYRHTQQLLHNTPSPTHTNSSTPQQSPRPFPSLSPLTSPLKPTPTLTPTTTSTTTSTAPLREWTDEEEYECMSKYMAQARILLVIAGGYDQNVSENVEYLDELQQHATSVELKHIYLKSTANTPISSHNSYHDPTTTSTATATPSTSDQNTTTGDQNYDPKDIEVVFRTSISDEERQLLLKKAAALLYTPDQEHFGIVPIEVCVYNDIYVLIYACIYLHIYDYAYFSHY